MDSDEADKNKPPWIMEEVSRGPCTLTWHFRFLVCNRKYGFFKVPKIYTESGRVVSEHGESFLWTRCISKGLRDYQEDRDIVGSSIVNLLESKKEDYVVFGCFDGHGQPHLGHKISDFCKSTFVQYTQQQLQHNTTQHNNNCTGEDDTMPQAEEKNQKNSRSLLFKNVLEKVCVELDCTVRKKLPAVASQNGTTACVVLIGESDVVFMNLGDSRAAKYIRKRSKTSSRPKDTTRHNTSHTTRHNTLDGKVCFATYDHKPTRPDEANRITSAGGWVSQSRVMGDLAVSRTIGDLEYKPQGSPNRLCPISICPAVDVVQRTKDNSMYEEFYIIATDGLWDAVSATEAFEFLLSNIALEEKKFHKKNRKKRAGEKTNRFDLEVALNKSVEKLVRYAFTDRLANDNLTVIVFTPIKEIAETGDVVLS